MLITLEGERPVTLNKYYAGMHWTERNEEADRVHMLVLASTMPLKAKIFEKPVDITVKVYFKDRPQDSDNIMAKMYIDGLKGRIITDDNRKYVRAVTTVSLVDKTRPRVEIEVVESSYGII